MREINILGKKYYVISREERNEALSSLRWMERKLEECQGMIFNNFEFNYDQVHGMYGPIATSRQTITNFIKALE